MLFAKNVEVTNTEELAYIRNLFLSVHSGTNAQKGLELVIPACKVKILSRSKSLAKRFGLSKTNLRKQKNNLWNFENSNTYHQEIRPALMGDGLIKEGISISNYLDGSTRMAALLHKDSPFKHFRDFLNASFVLSEGTDLEKILTCGQARAIGKLGAYRKTLELLRDLEAKMASRGLSINYQQVSNKEYHYYGMLI